MQGIRLLSTEPLTKIWHFKNCERRFSTRFKILILGRQSIHLSISCPRTISYHEVKSGNKEGSADLALIVMSGHLERFQVLVVHEDLDLELGSI